MFSCDIGVVCNSAVFRSVAVWVRFPKLAKAAVCVTFSIFVDPALPPPLQGWRERSLDDSIGEHKLRVRGICIMSSRCLLPYKQSQVLQDSTCIAQCAERNYVFAKAGDCS